MGSPVTEFGGRRCLDCGALLDDQTGLTSVVPKDGDVSVCLYCGSVAFYAANLHRLRRPTPSEEIELANDQRLLRILAGAAEVRRRYGAERT